MVQEDFMFARRPRKNSWIYKLILFLSFVWLEFYPATLELMYSFDIGYGNMFANANFPVVFATVISNAIFDWISFEILFWIYRWWLSHKIYSFIVPMDSLRAETRLYMIYRNVILGVINCLCFFYPYIYQFSIFFDVLVTLAVLICFAKHLNAVYSETIVGHFVFKCFCYPIFIYEAIEVLCSIWVVLS